MPDINEQQLMHDVLLEHVREQRRSRRWGYIFKFLILAYLVWVTLAIFGFSGSNKWENTDHTAVIDVKGEINSEYPNNALYINESLDYAFETKRVKGVILRINSPGGSPVQSALIYKRILKLRSKYPEKKIYAVIEELGTSAAYLIASACDEVYAADKTSFVGSIGVIVRGFGFVEAINKLGVERRVYSSGDNKNFLDPFMPVVPEQEAFLQKQINIAHQDFINYVKFARGDKLKADTPGLFSGLFWIASEAHKIGLIDGIQDVSGVTEEIIGTKDFVEYNQKLNFLDKISNRIENSSFVQGLTKFLHVI